MKARPGVMWYDIDLPDVCELRRKVMEEPKGWESYELLEVHGKENEWVDRVEAGRPTLIVMEGLVMYLTAEEGEALMRKMLSRFSGGKLIYDTAVQLFLPIKKVWSLRKIPAMMTSTMSNSKVVESWDKRLKMTDRNVTIKAASPGGVPLHLRIILFILSFLPIFRSGSVTFRYKF
jgi:O-methyltransferase involved in polyketide biosynthesis